MPFPSGGKVATPASPFKITPRKAAARGHANHGWLKTYHTFSFANYQEAKFDQFASLRVINEDRVEPGEGFGLHHHRDFEIWSYIVSGELEHKDSLGNTEIMKRGEIQMTSTGSGISHSEYNRNPKTPVHFLQIWGLPKQRGLSPKYYNRKFSDEEKRDKLVKVVAPVNTEGVHNGRNTTGPAPVHSAITMFASILSPKTSVTHTFFKTTTKAYLHNIMVSGYRSPSTPANEKFEDGGARIRLNNGLILEEGDGAFVEITKGEANEFLVENVGTKDAEWILFELE
ncbi:hypothetical protein MNV49_002114 [Pseudohyphozyma bogoriensis]|nr:hypothetical protein MNV49_002114 [Pseudohyphozyma bogoriensis]